MTDAVETSTSLSQEMIELKVRETIAKSLDIDVDDVQLLASLQADLGAESLDMLDIAFLLEREFRIEFPRMDLLQRASTHFGDELMMQDGVVTDFGLELIRKGMPEVDPSMIRSGMQASELARMIQVQTFVRIVGRLLEVKQQFPRECPSCGTTSLEESAVAPEFVCANCGYIQPLPSGDEILFQDLLERIKE